MVFLKGVSRGAAAESGCPLSSSGEALADGSKVQLVGGQFLEMIFSLLLQTISVSPDDDSRLFVSWMLLEASPVYCLSFCFVVYLSV